MTGENAQITAPETAGEGGPSGPPPSVAEHFERRAATDTEARALASSLRLRILRLTLDEALTNKEIAEALDRNPASVLHHVRTLVETGFLRAEPVRRGERGAREIPYRATGKSWYLDAPGVMTGPIVEAFVSEIASVPPEQRELARLRINGGDVEEFQKRLYELVNDFHNRPRDPQTPPHSVFIAMHPDTSTPRRGGQ
ncbi:ArsR/SmtB family transcription factor [Ornithinimicrobium cavernae]|uniref:ArsR/SmtB family transcription factor n=1 Tax=Ornithinimicrobium cavernae TaxID=2666047 RepID=UPI000D6975D4|nr:helix-turn-helix domain-containing protein [Ornithinimicrobium cavernae]